MRLSLRHYRAFCAIARSGSFVEAAEGLHVTSSALSLLIRDLEATWGFRVFERTTRKVALNQSGALMLPHVEHMLASLREVERIAQDVSEQRSGVVRVATTQVITWTLLTRFFAEFHRLWPGIRLEPIEVAAEDILGAVQRQEADIGISFNLDGLDDLRREYVFTSRAHMACTPDHRLAGLQSVAWPELQDEAIIFIGESAEMRYRVSVPEPVKLKAHYVVSNTSTALALVASGAGVALCTGYVKPMTRMHNLSLIPMSRPVLDRPFMLYYRKDKPMTPAVEACRGALLEYFAPYGSQPIEQVLT